MVYTQGGSLSCASNARDSSRRVAGHHIKSRALRTEVIDCDVSDGVHGTSSYLIDIPDGGARSSCATVNLKKGPLSENHHGPQS